jgi:hypothetical protein
MNIPLKRLDGDTTAVLERTRRIAVYCWDRRAGGQARARRRPQTQTAEQNMESGPSTVRVNTAARELGERLRKREPETAMAPDPGGRLVGVARLVGLEG